MAEVGGARPERPVRPACSPSAHHVILRGAHVVPAPVLAPAAQLRGAEAPHDDDDDGTRMLPEANPRPEPRPPLRRAYQAAPFWGALCMDGIADACRSAAGCVAQEVRAVPLVPGVAFAFVVVLLATSLALKASRVTAGVLVVSLLAGAFTSVLLFVVLSLLERQLVAAARLRAELARATHTRQREAREQALAQLMQFAALHGHGRHGRRGGRTGLTPEQLRLLVEDRDFTPEDYETLLTLDEDTPTQRRRALQSSDLRRLPTYTFTAKMARPAEDPVPRPVDPASGVAPPTLPSAETASSSSSSSSGGSGSGGASARDSSPSREPVDESRFRCFVCLEDFAIGETLRILPCCHQFHQPCIDRWLSTNAVCPICKFDVREALQNAEP